MKRLLLIFILFTGMFSLPPAHSQWPYDNQAMDYDDDEDDDFPPQGAPMPNMGEGYDGYEDEDEDWYGGSGDDENNEGFDDYTADDDDY